MYLKKLNLVLSVLAGLLALSLFIGCSDIDKESTSESTGEIEAATSAVSRDVWYCNQCNDGKIDNVDYCMQRCSSIVEEKCSQPFEDAKEECFDTYDEDIDACLEDLYILMQEEEWPSIADFYECRNISEINLQECADNISEEYISCLEKYGYEDVVFVDIDDVTDTVFVDIE